MPMPSSGIIVVEKPSSTASSSRITTNTSNSSNTINRHHPLHNHHHFHHQPQHHPPPQQKQQQQKQQQSTHTPYYDYYDANENQQLSSQQQQHPTIVVDGSVFQNQAQSQPQQQSIQLGGGRKLHTTTLSTTTPSSASASTSSLTLTSLLTSTTKPNLHIQSIKAGPMPQMTKQHPQEQQQHQIIQHTSHTIATATNSSNNSQQQQLHLQPSQQQHVQQVHLATSSTAQHQHPHHHHQQPPTQHQAHMIQVSEEYLEQTQVQAQNHTTASNMMISATGEVVQQQQIFKIVSTDAATGNMIIDTSGANQASNATATSKVLLSNLTVLSKQQAGATAAAMSAGQQQQSTAQTINFVNAKQLYTAASSASNPAGNPGVVAANLGKQQKFTVSSANLGGSFKTAALKQTTNTNQYVHQTAGSQQKINMSSSNRNIQMLTTTTRMQTGGTSVNHAGVIASSPATAQTMVLQQPHKFVTTNNTVTKSSLGPGGNVIKKAATTLRMSNNNTTAAKLMNNLHAQSAQGVKTFITQTTVGAQQQLQNNPNQLSSMQQQHHTKGGGKSKFVKQYNNAILNSAGAVAIATLPHQQHHQNTVNSSGQQQQAMQAQSAYMNHHKATAGQTKINKINSKYATANVAAQLPPGTQLHQKTLGQAVQQQSSQSYQGTNNSNIKFVNAQGTIIQQQQHQPLTPQKIHIKQQQPQYQSLQSFDTVDGNTIYTTQQQQQQPQQHHQATNATVVGVGVNSSAAGPNGNSSLLTDDIMMVNGTQMTDEISARILQSMSQKSFINQRYQQLQHQQQHPVFQKSPPTNNSNMLPPPQTAANSAISAASQQTASSHTQNAPNNNHSNILLSPREYTLYPPVGSSQPPPPQQQQQPPSPQHPPQAQSLPSPPNHFSNTSSATCGSLTTSSASNYLSNNMAIITPHSLTVGGVGGVVVGGIGGSTASSSSSSRVAQSAPNSRSQSMERKLHESSMSRKSTEYYKVNNHNSLRGSHSNLVTAQSGAAAAHTGGATNIAASPSTPSTPSAMSSSSSSSLSMSSTLMGSSVQGTILPPRSPSIPPSAMIEPPAQVIHLQATKTLTGANNSSNGDDDIIGEEVRPVPVETNDMRLQILHAVLLDHTYANPMPLELPTTFAVQLPSPSQSNVINASSGQHMGQVTAGTGPGFATTVQTQHLQWSLGGIGAVTTAVGPVANSGATATNVATSNYPMYSSQLSRLQQDDDAYSAISGSSRLVVGDIDPGEETETAPEAEAEDDSITRCICDLTHDDGYMICCDKCCAWQHVDCMGIDRQNIPDEYLCELCQPRPVDKSRARSLQVQKRKEQTQLIAQAQAAVAAGTMGAAGSASGNGSAHQANLLPNDILTVQQRFTAGVPGFSLGGNNPSDPIGLQLMASSGSNMKKGGKMLKKVKEATSGKKSKKAEKLSAAGGGLAGKAARKETKKNTKRKKSAHDGASTMAMTASEKHAANLRQWIESYELAVTNHYSPELRARLISISKPSKPLHSILNTENPVLKEFSMGNLENRATTVPHAGGKILISNLDISPNSPICELRGKYMLTTQYKTQNTSVNMNCPPPNNYHLASYKAHKTPGPFIFFYQMMCTEGTVNQGTAQTTTTTTLNPDGTYTTTTTTLPTQLSPPSQLKGPEIAVDTRTYGNEARFVRRSCRPNAEIQHLFEKGTIHLFIVALTDIRASTEITIRHEPHDLLAVDNKKSNTMVIQPTSTPCACGLSKDCIFGPPLPQLPPAAKSNAGRKSLALNGGPSGTGNLTAKQRKANQQNLNRNRSTSSSGDSNMGGSTVMVPIPTVALSLNSPNQLVSAKMAKNPAGNASAALLPLTASCNSNLSNASSTSSTLTSIMHDSGICTSSSSPSVSIPSPTQHMHSPIQQAPNHQLNQNQHQLHQQSQQQTLRPVQIVPQQQQQQQLMASLPTPLILATDMQPQQPPIHPQQKPPQQQQQQLQQQVLLQSPQPQLHPQQQLQLQPLTVAPQAATLSNLEIEKHPYPSEQIQGHLFITTPQQQQLQLIPPQQQQQPQLQPTPMQSCSVEKVPSQEETVDTCALQSFDCTPLPSNLTSDTDVVQQPQIVVIPTTDLKVEEPEQPPQPQPAPTTTLTEVETFQPQELATSAIVIAEPSAAATASVSSVCSSANSSPHQQKSPQKNNQSHQNNVHPGRKTPAKQARTTSFSEDNEQHNDESVVSATPNSSSTPKEKPKLSREDRKMEAILKAIEKMERNQQRKQEQKQTKRQNSGSHNTTPTSPNKTFDSADSSGTKRSNSQSAGGPTRTKKKRKAGNRGTAHNNQRKRRQSRMNSQESIEGCDPHANDTVTSESDGCAAIHSPPIQTLAPLKHSSAAITEPAPITCETIPNNVDQAAGLLMAFANPNVNSTQSTAVEPLSPQRSQHPPPQYMISPHEITTSPPCTPPSQVSSACLLIEAAVGPLESNLEPNSEPNSSDIINAEFKYPLQAKTKKLLMNNWLHQTEEISAGGTLEQTSPSQIACATGGLDSLVQAALNDFKQTQTEETTTQPQNLSIVAQRVEEFIQQTEGGPPTPPLTKHSYEYEQQQMYAMAMTSPAVDLSLKHQTIVHTAKPASDNKNFNLPLQVSTCSNNSSVKKRWLRQAISEETHEELQSNYSMSPSPTTPVAAAATSNFLNNQLQTVVAPMGSPSPVLTANNVPNGFTTPLKKRRLLLTDKDDEENVPQNAEDLVPSTPISPPPAESARIQQGSCSVLDEYEGDNSEISHLTMAVPHNIHEDADVDVEKCEQHDSSQDLPTATGDMEQEQDVDVISPPLDEEPKTDIVTKHMTDNDIKEEENDPQCLVPPTPLALGTPAEFNDQDDDVDILRSPSPGREMIKAEDNLVKIEPEDTSGTDDVKIDVEREESIAADDIMVHQLKQECKEETLTEPCSDVLKVEQMEIKHEHKMEPIGDDARGNDVQSVCKTEFDQNSRVKVEERQDEMTGPKPKKLKLEDTAAEHKSVIVKGDTRQQNENIKHENSDVVITKQEAILIPKEAMKTEMSRNESEEVSSTSTVRNVAKVAADSTFTSTDSDTPPLPTSTQSIQYCATSASVCGAPLQSNKILSDDDIQARLHNFHKENILFLQSRNKKSKSSNSTSSSSNSLLEHHHRNNNKTNSSSSSANHHHHHHDGKEKSDKLLSKHHKNSSSSSSSSGSSKKQKLHKRERTTSSGASSNSHKNSTTQHVSSTSTFTKSAVINSSTNSLSSTSSSSSSSSKKIKSLKKSSSSSSTSSTNSTSSSTQQNSHTSSLDNKDKHQRQRTTSNSSNTATSATTSAPAPQTPFGTSKKRQLNFELELTKDMHLVNSVVTSSGKHKRLEDSQGPVSAKKSRKESSSSTTKDEQKNGTNKPHKSSSSSTDKPLEKEKKPSAVNVVITSSAPAKSSPPIITSATHPATANVTTAIHSEDVKNSTELTMPNSTPAPTILREHPTLPHFNNIVLTPGMNSLSTPPHQTAVTTPAVQPPQPPPPPSQNIPNPSCAPQIHAHSQLQSALTDTTSPSITSPLSTSNHLPFFNTIYGKLLDNHTPSLSSPVAAPPSVQSIAAVTVTVPPSVATTGVLSEYQDTKLKSYNTLGGYVSHTALFGLNNTPTKDILVVEKESSNEMPAPLAPPCALTVSATASSLSLTLNAATSSSTNVSAMKIHTKTASHDPRLNPHLTAPEPPPQPKRKLSINEYRKRMQQSSSNDSASNSLASTPTTPPTPMETASTPVAGGIPVIINKCTLNSEHLTQSVDSQIQKEIIASSSLNVYDSLNSSNSSSTSNSSLLNDSLLKSSSIVEEDSTKGQFNAAPTLLEKQQESLCARLKSLKEKQGLALGGGDTRSRFSSFSEGVASIAEYSLRKDGDDFDILGKRNHSISSSIGGGDLLDNCLEEISSTSTSMSSSREPSPERYTATSSHHGKHVLTASATTTSSTSTGQTKQHHSTGDNKTTQSSNVERKKSVDIA